MRMNPLQMFAVWQSMPDRSYRAESWGRIHDFFGGILDLVSLFRTLGARCGVPRGRRQHRGNRSAMGPYRRGNPLGRIPDFFILAVGPMLKTLDPATRAKVFPELAAGRLWWLRWSAMVSWLAGFRYLMILAKTDAVNTGRPHAWGGWIGIWFACWLAAFAIEMVLIRAGEGAL